MDVGGKREREKRRREEEKEERTRRSQDRKQREEQTNISAWQERMTGRQTESRNIVPKKMNSTKVLWKNKQKSI